MSLNVWIRILKWWHILVIKLWRGHLVHNPNCWNLIICQNVRFFQQNSDGNIKFKYIYIIIAQQIDEKPQNSLLVHQNSPEFSESMWTNIGPFCPSCHSHGLREFHHKTSFYVKMRSSFQESFVRNMKSRMMYMMIVN